MVSSSALPSTARSAPLSLSSSSPSSLANRSLLAKSARRLIRTARTEARLFAARPLRQRPWTLPVLVVSVLLVAALVAARLLMRKHHQLPVFHEPPREETHFSHNVHTSLPSQAPFSSAALHPCSWLYMEFGARDGRHLDSFFSEGSGFLEEFLRATQGAMRAFCGLAFEGDQTLAQHLLDVRKIRGTKAFRFNVYSGVVPGNMNASESVTLKAVDDASKTEQLGVQSIDVADTVLRLTFPWEKSGQEVSHMNTAKGNGNWGAVIVRFNMADIREAYWHLDSLQSSKRDGVMCTRIDRLILNMQRMPLDPNSVVGDVEDRELVRDWDKLIPPTASSAYDPKKGVAGLVDIAKEVNEREGCRTTIHVIDEAGRNLWPRVLNDREVLYAILAGHPTFDERVGAQTESWMTAVPQDRLTIFTNEPRNADEMVAARGRDVAVVHPHEASLEQRLPLMQSWSHLVRVRESWDRTMKDNKDIKWLALVDDDTFVFPGGLREYLSKFDHRMKIWGGSGEQARVDNGDAGMFANWLRDLHEKYGGKHCYLPDEDIPKGFRGAHMEYGVSEVLNGRRVGRKVSHMCEDMFCKLGCPAVPQGAAIFLSRALVEALRPHIEQCERETAKLCRNCGSQRLYMCVNRYAGPARTLLTRGICRAPWKLEHREQFPFVLTFHGFNRYRGAFLSTQSLHGDMLELWQLGKSYEEGVKQGFKTSYLVPMSEVADLVGCHGQGKYHKGECITTEGIKLAATDGKHDTTMGMDGQRAADRKGSA